MSSIEISIGGPDAALTERDIEETVSRLLENLSPRRRVLLVPPDYTRFHSCAGEITVELYRQLKGIDRLVIFPALGTHTPMTPTQLDSMYPGIPHRYFHVHDWRNSVVHIGDVPAGFVAECSGGKYESVIRAEIASTLLQESWDQIISIGQVVPHEVAGMANFTKNIFVGLGGFDSISKTHFTGAVCGMEQIMGRAENPVRHLYEYMAREFTPDLPVSYILTVRERLQDGALATRGIFAGNSKDTFLRAAELSKQVNITLLESPIEKAVVFLDAGKFRSTWLGNKAIYRTRMALADDAELIVIAPGIESFGEDADIDRLIRRFGYRGTEATLAAVKDGAELGGSLAAAAHLIHASTEGRFRVTYCPGGLSRQEVESVNYGYETIERAMDLYRPGKMKTGWNELPSGEQVFFIADPGLGLWATAERFSMDDGERP